MPNRNPDVDDYIAKLDHPDREAIDGLRLGILDLDERITESVKWNAPNFLFDGEDRVTFRLKPGTRYQLILHRGATKRDDVDVFEFDDPTGRIEWATPDRGTLTLAGTNSEGADRAQATDLVDRWMRATT